MMMNMTDDTKALCERLRNRRAWGNSDRMLTTFHPDCAEAADTIERLGLELAEERKRGDRLWQECENLRVDLKYERDAAYERAAQVCEWADDERGNACARAIRALKGKQ
jgi:hypothetical protein